MSSPAPGAPRTLDLKVGYDCNNRCIHCAVSDQRGVALALRGNANRSLRECGQELRASRDRGARLVVLTGGEPTIRPDLLDIARQARALGFQVALQTNGRRFCYPDYARQMSRVVDWFSVALHGATAAVHDAVTRIPGSHAQTMAGIQNLVEAGAWVAGKVVLSQQNYAELPALVARLDALGAARVNVAFPHAIGAAGRRFETVVPRYSAIREALEAALADSLARGLALELEAVLPCALRRRFPAECFADLRRPLRTEVKQLDRQTPQDWDQARVEQKRRGPRCDACAHDNHCEGYWKEYVERFGWSEFEPPSGR